MRCDERVQRLLGSFREGDLAGGFYQLLKLAKEGQEDRYFEVGLCYEQGYGVSQDVSKAIEWYQRSALEAHAARDREKAERYLQKAASLGHLPSVQNLAYLAWKKGRHCRALSLAAKAAVMKRVLKVVRPGDPRLRRS